MLHRTLDVVLLTEEAERNCFVVLAMTDVLLLSELIECGLEVRACGMALDDCEIDESAMLPGIERGSMKALASWVKDSDPVMVF